MNSSEYSKMANLVSISRPLLYLGTWGLVRSLSAPSWVFFIADLQISSWPPNVSRCWEDGGQCSVFISAECIAKKFQLPWRDKVYICGTTTVPSTTIPRPFAYPMRFDLPPSFLSDGFIMYYMVCISDVHYTYRTVHQTVYLRPRLN